MKIGGKELSTGRDNPNCFEVARVIPCIGAEHTVLEHLLHRLYYSRLTARRFVGND